VYLKDRKKHEEYHLSELLIRDRRDLLAYHAIFQRQDKALEETVVMCKMHLCNHLLGMGKEPMQLHPHDPRQEPRLCRLS
jgi:hypothetical protein